MPPTPVILEPSFVEQFTPPTLGNPAAQILGPGGYPISSARGAIPGITEAVSTYSTHVPRGLPAAGTTGIYNNAPMARRAAAASRLGGEIPGGVTRAGQAAPRGFLGGGARAAGGVADDVAAGVVGAADDAAPSYLRQLIGGAAGGGAGITRAVKLPGLGAPILAAGKGAGLVRGVGGLVAGSAASGLVDKINVGGEGSNWDKFASGAAGGAVTGGIIGGFNPVSVIGGGLIGGAANLLFGGDKANPAKDFDKQVRSALSAVGLEGEQVNSALSQFHTAYDKAQGDDAKAGVIEQYNLWFGEVAQQQAETQAAQNPLQSLLGTGSGGQSPEAQSRARAADILATQAAIANIMQPYTQGMIDSSNAEAKWLTDYANRVGGAEGDLYKLQAAQLQGSQNRMAAAYMAQAQLIPRTLEFNAARAAMYQQPAASGDDWQALTEALTGGAPETK